MSLLLFLATQGIQAKPIHLRNETLIPESATASQLANTAPAALPATGLLLIQFKVPPGPETVAQLAAAGVELLHYVPEDTFVARARNAGISQLRALPSVAWVGAYRPEHKVHRALRTPPASGTVGVAIILAPHASAAEIAAVRSSLAAVQQQSSLRLGTILRGQVQPSQIALLSRLDSVLWLEPFHAMKLVDEVASKIVAGDGGPNVLLSQSLGYDGAGVKVAVADTGLNNGDAASMHPDLFGRTPTFLYYGSLTDAADEHSHGTHVAGIVAGNGATGEVDDNGALYGLGVAPGAGIVTQRIFDGDGNYEPPANGNSQLTRDATDAGAVIGSNSWGDDVQGAYDSSAAEFDELVRDATGYGTNNRPYILEFSAGNAGPGPQTMDTPAVAKNVIATGACENDRPDFFIYADGPDAMADFSSRGPCADGRIKPDVVAPGTWISSLQSESASDANAWLGIDSYYQYQGGTSQAGPHASGAAAVFVQFYRQTHSNTTPSPALVKAALINSATDMDDSYGTGPVPNMDEGWGRVDLTPFFASPLTFQFIDQSNLLTNSQVFERHVLIASPEAPLKITLAYTDVPGFPGAIPALVNDLDLEVTASDGKLYRGNQFDSGESVPNPSGPDTINNVEAVHLAAPFPGEYVVRVRARNVVSDIFGAPGLPQQDFALVISGLIPAPGTSAIILDRASYTAPSRINITVIDSDQAGQPSVNALARSSTEPNSENVLLVPAGIGGSFTGALATATGTAAQDGRLQIANNDTITVTYFDASSGSNHVATAVADLLAPGLRAVFATNSFGQEVVSWVSDEPAASLVYYGTNPALATMTMSVTNPALTTDHSLTLGGLVAGVTYYYYVVSADAAGNTTITNSNGAGVFSFVAATTAPVLLVDEYYPDNGFEFQPPPITGYTDPLNALGVNYDFWDAVNHGAPTNVLKSYRAVIWRVPELQGAWDASERFAISNYLHHGGALFVASMQIISRLESEQFATNFVNNVLQVQNVVADDNTPPSTGADEIIGSPYDQIGSGLDITMDYDVYANLEGIFGIPLSDVVDPTTLPETITPMSAASVVMRNQDGDIVGLRWPAAGQQAPGRLVFFTFPLDAAPMNGGINDRIALLRNALSFLVPGFSGLASVELDSPAYTLPSLVTVEVGDPDMAGHGTVTVAATSTTQTNALSLPLFETEDAGIFLGSFPLISATNPPVAGRLRAADGDNIRVVYFDASSNSVVAASATVDTVPPVISGVTAEPDYQQATISWSTSKPTDATVQFGASALLDRTAYEGELTTTHSIALPNLRPDTVYFYEVVSRDIAGNTAVDDFHGDLYKFHTLTPLYAPWSDFMDTGATNWSVYSADSVDSEWTLGVPRNGKETQANSPPDAWGSNLDGGPIGYSETFLISPAIGLPPGKSATLNFTQSYDFSTEADLDIFEYGQVLLITNNDATTAITLSTYSDDATSGWVGESIDLTPYAGQLVYLVWDYELLSFDGRPRAGWLLDDVSITVSSLPFGTIRITNNLWQASYSLTGPATFNRTGLGTTLSNAPTGQYVIKYLNVPFYDLTPPCQTNTLTSGSTVVFKGNYGFTDINANGMPDAWEQYFFGAVSPTRTRQTDTDGDGVTDYAEFMAGTDPNKAPGPFHVTAQRLSSTICRLSWPSFPAQQYRVHVSTNLVTWQLYTPSWIQTNQLDVPISSPAKGTFFRVEAQSTLAPSLSLSLQRSPANGAMSLSWLASVGRGYCVLGSTNAVNWAPIGNWFQATNAAVAYPLPAASGNRELLLRVQVQP